MLTNKGVNMKWQTPPIANHKKTNDTPRRFAKVIDWNPGCAAMVNHSIGNSLHRHR
jgi:hypothetical protein